MKIKSIRIENIRSFKDETINFGDYTCFVGPNGAGKSAVFCALNIFFRDSTGSVTDLKLLEEEDFHCKDTANPVRVTVTFNDLSEEAQVDFQDYFRQGELTVTAEAHFDSNTRHAPVKQYGQRLGIEEFADFFSKFNDQIAAHALKQVYDGLKAKYAELPSWRSKDYARDALRAFELQHVDRCELLQSEDQFYGISKGADRLAKYIQWVFVPAVKDAATEQSEARNSALGKLLARTVRNSVNFDEDILALENEASKRYGEIIAGKQSALNALSESLRKRLSEWAHPDVGLKLKWRQDEEKAVRVQDPVAEILADECGFEGKLSRFGHGLQRSYLLALLQELAIGNDSTAPRLILACEEPELYQHPPQIRHLSEVLEQLSEQDAQVMLCTHSPYFVTGKGFEAVRLIRKPSGSAASTATQVTLTKLGDVLARARGDESPRVKEAGVLAKINQALQPSLSEIFFARAIVLVEGLEDVAYITAHLHLGDHWTKFRELGLHLIPAVGKSRMVEPLAICKEMKIPVFVVFDSDGQEHDSAKRSRHEFDNKVLLNLCELAKESSMPSDTLWADQCVMWKSEIGTVVKDDFDSVDYARYKQAAENSCGQIGDLDKNTMFIASLLAEAHKENKTSFSLEKLCLALLKFAETVVKCGAVAQTMPTEEIGTSEEQFLL